MVTAASDSYVDLLQKFPPRSIRWAAERDAVHEVIDVLLDSEQLSPEQQNYLNVLGMLMHDYEEKHVPILDLSGVALLKVPIQEFGLKQRDLVPIFKTESIVSANRPE